MPLSPLAGKIAPPNVLIDVARLRAAYASRAPDVDDPAQLVAFGTSGHRGAPEDGAFNEAHILAITQAICEHRARAGITGPLFLGVDTHAASEPAQQTALEVLAANDVETLLAPVDAETGGAGFTPTPALSRAILAHNRGRAAGDRFADGIVITPSHNPPRDGGFKYNPPHGGPADSAATRWIQDRANELIAGGLREVRRTTEKRHQKYDFLAEYVDALPSVLDIDAIRAAGVRIGADPLGGASVRYWAGIAMTQRQRDDCCFCLCQSCQQGAIELNIDVSDAAFSTGSENVDMPELGPDEGRDGLDPKLEIPDIFIGGVGDAQLSKHRHGVLEVHQI